MIKIKISYEDPEELQQVQDQLRSLPVRRIRKAKGARYNNLYLELKPFEEDSAEKSTKRCRK